MNKCMPLLWVLAVLLLQVPTISYGQNLILNGDLEDLYLHTYHLEESIDGIIFTNEATNDTAYSWNLVDKKLAHVTCKYWNYNADTSSAYSCYYSNAGFSRSGTNLNVIEIYKTWGSGKATVTNVAATICKPLIEGKRYKVSLYIKPLYGNFFTNNIGMWVVKDPLELRYEFDPKTAFASGKGKPLIACSANCYKIERIINDTAQFTKVEFFYTAAGGEQYVYIGNLFFQEGSFWKKNSWQKVEMFGMQENKANYFMCYYAVDDVSVIPLDNAEDGCPENFITSNSLTENTAGIADTIFIGEVYFTLNSHIDTFQLENIISHINKVPNHEILVVGHADENGDKGYNYELSLRRAKYIAAILEKRIDLKVYTYGEGENKPKYQGQQAHLNRRVEIYSILRSR